MPTLRLRGRGSATSGTCLCGSRSLVRLKATDPGRIQVVSDWPTLRSELRGVRCCALSTELPLFNLVLDHFLVRVVPDFKLSACVSYFFSLAACNTLAKQKELRSSSLSQPHSTGMRLSAVTMLP